ncbi:Uncharacterised protein [Kytococcus sedentarius]|uniref:Uncharacterized protein n=1 Tax=Kytococcus sedentarius (strain ATCC 14392 / DSM 20547 / JCM 11482 / CCUG 33030 / NBRC 15357 / NCTC 11040 / CCM 314 / 541) TaxID=478801 RepID=C7NKS3_KYTSD|nr:hypothetical protein Ksed_04890 [Kytococcus sedentarius DSM 20547]STX13027.1 Uncharacterised protein [Kytococcus sedentarius]
MGEYFAQTVQSGALLLAIPPSTYEAHRAATLPNAA